MKGLWYVLIVLGVLVFAVGVGFAQTDQMSAGKAPIAQPLIREGDFAVRLAGYLNLGTVGGEVEAESVLTGVGISPRNGWIADYPVTPDIAGELRTAVGSASDRGVLTLGKDQALAAFDGLMSEYNIAFRPDTSGGAVAGLGPSNYPNSEAESNYYSDEGPPVVTYYAPPYDYAYLYSWVPYPFWWWDYWFPGFFVLADFDRVIVADRDHDRDRHHHRDGEHFSNHFFDSRSGAVSRVDPSRRPSDSAFVAGGMTGGTGTGRGMWAGSARFASPPATPGNRVSVPSYSGRRSSGTSGNYSLQPHFGGVWYRGQTSGGMHYSQPSVNRSFGSFNGGFAVGRSFGRR